MATVLRSPAHETSLALSKDNGFLNIGLLRVLDTLVLLEMAAYCWVVCLPPVVTGQGWHCVPALTTTPQWQLL